MHCNEEQTPPLPATKEDLQNSEDPKINRKANLKKTRLALRRAVLDPQGKANPWWTEKEKGVHRGADPTRVTSQLTACITRGRALKGSQMPQLSLKLSHELGNVGPLIPSGPQPPSLETRGLFQLLDELLGLSSCWAFQSHTFHQQQSLGQKLLNPILY